MATENQRPSLNAERTCEQCGVALPPRAPAGLCPNCLLSQAVRASAESSQVGLETASGDSSARRLGDYELIERIATGGMGVVYKARQLSLNRILALKMISPGRLATEEQVSRFLAEAEAVASLQHPHIVAIHETGQWEGQHYFSMQYVAGQNLADTVRTQPMPAVRAAEVLKGIAEAVHYAHQRRILHRDLKPSNIILDQAGEPHVTDFGLAKRLDHSPLATGHSPLTLTGQVLGSPGFMPPEQATGQPGTVDVRSDVYGLGAILYYVLTGRPPFQAATISDTLKQLAEAEPIAPRLLNPSVPKDLATICLKCLEKDLPHRYPTAQALAEELGRFLRGEPILARPTSLVGRAGRWCRRNPSLATVTAVAVLSAVLGLAGVLWQWRRAATGELLARQNAYAADMQGVQAALAEGDMGEALSCLNHQRPATGQRDLRGWEWRYFWKRCRSDERFLLHAYPNSVGVLAFSADGKWLALRRERGAVALWDTQARRLVAELAGSGRLNALALSPGGDLLAYGDVGSNGMPVVSVWNVTTKQTVQLLHSSAPVYLGFSADGQFLASMASDGSVRLWQIETWGTVRSLQLPRREDDTGGRNLFSARGPHLAIADDHAIRLWHWTSGRQRSIPLPRSEDDVDALALSTDGRRLAAVCSHTILIWDLSSVWEEPADSEVPLDGPPIEHPGGLLDLAIAPDHQTLATAGVDQSVRLWDLSRRREIRRYQGNTHEVWAVAFSPDGQQLASGGRDGSVRFWDPVPKPATPTHVVLPMRVWSGGFGFAPDGKRFIALDSRDGSASLWDTATVRQLEMLSYLGTSNRVVKWSPDGRLFAVGDWQGTLRVWDFASHRLLTNFVNAGKFVGAVRFAGGERSLMCGLVAHTPRGSRSVRVWNVADWREHPLPVEGSQNVMWAAVSPDNRTYAALTADGTVSWWELASGRRMASFPQYFASLDGYLAFSPDSRTLAASARDGLTTLWDVATGRVLRTVRANVQAVFGIAFSPDGQRLISGGGDPSDVVRLMDLGTGRYVARLPGENDAFWFLEMSADGDTLAAAGINGTTLLWRAPSWAEIEAAEKAQGAR
ncbi:MAG: WD40 repeat domain-containing serine/threonine protein kinase [Verrucomicrobiia bacterium]